MHSRNRLREWEENQSERLASGVKIYLYAMMMMMMMMMIVSFRARRFMYDLRFN
jgi:hypothetical protein